MRSERRYYGLTLFAVGILYPAWSWFFLMLYPTVENDLEVRIASSLITLSFAFFTLLPEETISTKHLRKFLHLAVFIVTSAYIYFATINCFSLETVPGVFMVTALASYILSETKLLIHYIVFLLISILCCGYYVSDEPNFSRPDFLFFILGTVSILFIGTFIWRSHYHMREKLERQTQIHLQMAKWTEVGKLAGGVLHELGSPLSALRIYLEVIREKSSPAQKLEEAHLKIDQLFNRIEDIIHSLRAVSHTNIRSTPITLNLEEIVNESIALFESRFRLEQIKLLLNIDPQHHVVGRETPLIEVFTNLISNSCDALSNSKLKGIKISSSNAGDSLIVSVFDSGSGIGPESLIKLWEPYFTTKDYGKGTGLGLPIVKKLVEEMGGQIHVYSPAENGWSTEVRIYFPQDPILGNSD